MSKSNKPPALWDIFMKAFIVLLTLILSAAALVKIYVAKTGDYIQRPGETQQNRGP